MRRNIDAWWPHIEAGAEKIVMTASGCGVMVKDYGHALAHDPRYATKAKRVSEMTRDIGEVLLAEQPALADAVKQVPPAPLAPIAFHSPCTLQHGLQIRGTVESLLREAGFQLTFVPDAHLCCGSAGTYSILQPELSQRLLVNKVQALESGQPETIATANIGCLAHLQGAATVPVRHWIEMLDDRLGSQT
jgi:glycolate oxidase iron-sulfur subunit